METTTTSETTYRAVYIHANNYGRTLCIIHDTADEAWANVDSSIARAKEQGIELTGRWTVEQTTTTTTTTEVVR